MIKDQVGRADVYSDDKHILTCQPVGITVIANAIKPEIRKLLLGKIDSVIISINDKHFRLKLEEISAI